MIWRLGGVVIAAWMAGGGILPAQETSPAGSSSSSAPVALSPVLLAENPEVVQRFAVDGQTVRQMLNREILTLTSASDIGTAWKRLGIVPQDTVGIKITTMGGLLLSTHKPIVQAICDGLEAAGLPPSHILIWDKSAEDMVRAGYAPTPTGENNVGISAVFPGTGYDPDVTYKNEIIGSLIWGDFEFTRGTEDDLLQSARNSTSNDPVYGSRGLPSDPLSGNSAIPRTSNISYYAKLVTRTCTKIINVPVLTDNAYIGVNGCLGSLALGCVDNDRRFQGDPTYGDPAICEILNRDFIKKKVVIHILDALIPEYAGGPRFNPQFTVPLGAIYVSRDPVAIDWLVLPRLERWRKAASIDPIGKTANHIGSAAVYGLGTNDPRRIQFIKLP